MFNLLTGKTLQDTGVKTIQIRTPSSVLRDWTPEDIRSLVQHANNPRVAAMMRDAFPSPYTEEDARRFITLATTPGPHLFLAIEVNGEAQGGIGIHVLDDVYRHSAEIGYWISESCWGNGIATDAVRAMAPVAFETFDIKRLQAGIFESNKASMRVLEKCGFAREAIHMNAITKNGVIMDEIVYVLLR